MIDLTARLGDVYLQNPIMPASGTFSDDLAQVFDLNRLGALVLKTITRELREGNPLPRVAETSNGLLNSIGIPSKGVADFKENVLPLYRHIHPPLIISLSAPSYQGFASLASELSVEGVSALEINLSCPNIEEDGRSFAMSASATREVIEHIRAATKLPLWVKLTPNAGDIAEVARAAERGGADVLVVANTILAMAIDVKSFQFRLGKMMGGLSGPAVKSIILRQVYQCSKAVKIPIVGCGGISRTEDVVEYLLAGATAVQVGTATFVRPTTMPMLIDGLEQFCANRGINSVRSLIGKASDKHIRDAAPAMAEASL